jgi:hypothetical protein
MSFKYMLTKQQAIQSWKNLKRSAAEKDNKQQKTYRIITTISRLFNVEESSVTGVFLEIANILSKKSLNDICYKKINGKIKMFIKKEKMTMITQKWEVSEDCIKELISAYTTY